MKKNIFTLSLIAALLFSLFQFAFSQSLKWTYDNYYSNYNPEGRDKDVAFDSYGNTFVLYEKYLDYGSAGGWKQMAFNKIDSIGNVIANEVYIIDDTSTVIWGDAKAKSIRVDEKGNIYASCYTDKFHAFLKLDNNLQLIFMKKFYGFIPVTSGIGFNSYYVCGNTPDGAAVLRYNKSTGALQQFNQYEKATVYDGEITNSGFAIAGTIEGVGQGNQMFLQSYDSLLTLKWTFLYNYTNGNYNDDALQMKVSGNNIYVSGTSESPGAAFGTLLKINDAGTLQWSRRLISGANLNTLKSLAVDAGADQAYVLTEQQRVIKYNSNGAQLFNRLIPLPTPSLGGMYNYITTDGRPGQMASKVILGGTNSYKKYYYALPDSNYFRLWDQSVIRSLHVSNGAVLNTDKFIINCSYNYVKAEHINFSTKLLKMNFNVIPTQMVALIDGNCSNSQWDVYNYYRVSRCFNMNNGAKVAHENQYSEQGINLFPNPANDLLTIETSLENFACAIYNVNGKLLIYEEKHRSGDALNIKSLKPGLYLITISDGEQSANYKFTKSNE